MGLFALAPAGLPEDRITDTHIPGVEDLSVGPASPLIYQCLSESWNGLVHPAAGLRFSANQHAARPDSEDSPFTLEEIDAAEKQVGSTGYRVDRTGQNTRRFLPAARIQ